MSNRIQQTLNLNETALLGLLADKPRYGYELDKIIKERLVREWTDIAFSSIYAILKGLEKKSCVESSAEIAGNRVRRHYAITRQGRKTLRASTLFMLSEPSKTPDSLLAGLANKDLLDADDLRKALVQRSVSLKNQLELAGSVAAGKRGKEKAYYDALAARTKGRVSEELRFVEELLGGDNAPKDTTEAIETPEPAAEIHPEPILINRANKPPEADSPLTKQPKKGSEEGKQTLF